MATHVRPKLRVAGPVVAHEGQTIGEADEGMTLLDQLRSEIWRHKLRMWKDTVASDALKVA